jgi:hypothetical protein
VQENTLEREFRVPRIARLSEAEAANIILQHIYSMNMSYPLIWEQLDKAGSTYWLHNHFADNVAATCFAKLTDESQEAIRSW